MMSRAQQVRWHSARSEGYLRRKRVKGRTEGINQAGTFWREGGSGEDGRAGAKVERRVALGGEEGHWEVRSGGHVGKGRRVGVGREGRMGRRGLHRQRSSCPKGVGNEVTI